MGRAVLRLIVWLCIVALPVQALAAAAGWHCAGSAGHALPADTPPCHGHDVDPVGDEPTDHAAAEPDTGPADSTAGHACSACAACFAAAALPARERPLPQPGATPAPTVTAVPMPASPMLAGLERPPRTTAA